jgi:hypothetical protein
VIVAIMQPYFFPYVGYFQLMAAVDHFVIYDDAQYMKGGWLNRNRLLYRGQAHWWTRAVQRADYRLPIFKRSYAVDRGTAPLIAQMNSYYAQAKHFTTTSELVRPLLEYEETNVALYNERLLARTASHLGLTCSFIRSSSLDVGESQAQGRVIRMCKALGATQYVNMIGGRDLYAAEAFDAAGIELSFLRPTLTPYQQFGAPFVPGLSIVDALMFNEQVSVSTMCTNFTLIRGWS